MRWEECAIWRGRSGVAKYWAGKISLRHTMIQVNNR